MPRHSHELAYLSLVLRGSYTETIGHKELLGKPSALVAHPPAQAHAVDFHASDVRIFRTEIRPRWLERLRDWPAVFEGPACFDAHATTYLALRLYKEFRAPDQFSTLAVEGILLELLAEISRHRKRRFSSKRVPRWLERAREMLHEQTSNSPSLAELASEAGVHPVHLAREFRKFYHASVGEYVRRLRVESACREMAATDLPLSQIAANAGFYDQSHFSRAFKQQTGLTPAAYRSLVRVR
jgi:AraC family transcriptional regulator